MISRATGPLARSAYAVRLGSRRHHERDDVSTCAARTVSVSGEAFWCSADGEIYGPERQRTWHVEPAAYQMVLPYGLGDRAWPEEPPLRSEPAAPGGLDPGLEARVGAELGHQRRRRGAGRCAG